LKNYFSSLPYTIPVTIDSAGTENSATSPFNLKETGISSFERLSKTIIIEPFGFFNETTLTLSFKALPAPYYTIIFTSQP
jgi:hypothetical protein